MTVAAGRAGVIDKTGIGEDREVVRAASHPLIRAPPQAGEIVFHLLLTSGRQRGAGVDQPALLQSGEEAAEELKAG